MSTIPVQCSYCGAPFPAGATVCAYCKTERPVTVHAFGGVPAPAAGALGGGGEEVDGVDARMIELIERGLTIEAIKAYRERHGVGLREAKDAIDEWKRKRKGARR
jgi:ribosomal protein L7/L12